MTKKTAAQIASIANLSSLGMRYIFTIDNHGRIWRSHLDTGELIEGIEAPARFAWHWLQSMIRFQQRIPIDKLSESNRQRKLDRGWIL